MLFVEPFDEELGVTLDGNVLWIDKYVRISLKEAAKFKRKVDQLVK